MGVGQGAEATLKGDFQLFIRWSHQAKSRHAQHELRCEATGHPGVKFQFARPMACLSWFGRGEPQAAWPWPWVHGRRGWVGWVGDWVGVDQGLTKTNAIANAIMLFANFGRT